MALRRPPTASEGFGRLADLWLTGLSRSHDPGCGCGGLFSPALEADAIENDLTDYLLARYRQQNRHELVRLIEARKSDGGSSRFEDWIAALDHVSLSADDRTLIETDLRTFLESFGSQSRSGVGVCY